MVTAYGTVKLHGAYLMDVSGIRGLGIPMFDEVQNVDEPSKQSNFPHLYFDLPDCLPHDTLYRLQ